ncbi:MAG: uracil-DNA glycosylase [Actinobacteria bacterium]|nr:uracil-DNA glycosylase [Actinomycetota bacterium]
MVVVAEAPAPDPGDSLFAPGVPFFLETTLDAFRAAGLEAMSLRDLTEAGIYPTTAVKCAKQGYGVSRPTVEACSRLLETELDLFPRARVIMLMGDVAIGALNSIARRRTGKRLTPSGPTWKVRQGEYWFEGKRVFPSYLQTGRSYLIERSKREMIAADLKAALALIGG